MTTQPVSNKTAVGKSPPSWNQIRVLFFSIASVYPSAGRTATARGIHYSYTFLKPLSVDPKPSRAYSAPPRLSIDPADVIRSLPSPDTPLPLTESPVEPVIASLDTFPQQAIAKHCDKLQDHSLPVVALDEPVIQSTAQDSAITIQSPVVEEPASPTSNKLDLDPVEEVTVSQPTVIDSLSDVPPTTETLVPAESVTENIPLPCEEEVEDTPTAESSLFETTPSSPLAEEEAFVSEHDPLSESEPLVAQEPVSVTEAEQLPEPPAVNEVPVDEPVSTVLDDAKDPSTELVSEPPQSITEQVLDEPIQELPIASADDISAAVSSEPVETLDEPSQQPEAPVVESEQVPEPAQIATEKAPTAPIRPSPTTSSSRLPILRSSSTPMTPDKRRTSKIPAARPTMSFSLKTASKVDLKAKPNESKLKTQPSTPLPGRAIPRPASPRPASPRPSSPRPSPRSPIKSASSNVLSSARPRPVSRMREADVPMAKKTGKKKEDEDEEDKPPARLTVQEKRRREAMRAQQIKLWRVREEREARDARTVARRKMMEEGANEIRRRRQLANGTSPTITTTNTPSPPRRAVKFNLKRNKVIEITQESIE